MAGDGARVAERHRLYKTHQHIHNALHPPRRLNGHEVHVSDAARSREQPDSDQRRGRCAGAGARRAVRGRVARGVARGPHQHAGGAQRAGTAGD